ncbi:MAG TPA: thiamine phosphate synthase, partial [Burkholderiaceae bacterium]|nr:thiamine phosphate synthase [Burkholderiaceae bacterium]
RGLRLLQFREPVLDRADATSIFGEVLARVRAAGATLLVNSRHQRALWEQADGVHLTAADLAATKQRPKLAWVAASTHCPVEIERAAVLDVDFVVAGPVRPTATHADNAPLGWSAFADLVANTPMPVYALGGMQAIDLANAMRYGAHGVASLSAVWSDQCLVDTSLRAVSSVSACNSAGIA